MPASPRSRRAQAVAETTVAVFNLDKMGYASDPSSIEVLSELGEAAKDRHRLLQVDLIDAAAVEAAVRGRPRSGDAPRGREQRGSVHLRPWRIHREQRQWHPQPPAGGVGPLRRLEW